MIPALLVCLVAPMVLLAIQKVFFFGVLEFVFFLGVAIVLSIVVVAAGMVSATISIIVETQKLKPKNIVTEVLAMITFGDTIIAIIAGVAIFALFMPKPVGIEAGIVFIKTVSSTWTVIVTAQIAGIGLGFWYRAKDIIDWGRYLAIFAFPLFCTFPIVLGYSSYAFYDWFGLTWQQITIIWIGILGVCTVLWKWGQKLDYEARNPFKGILDSVRNDSDTFN